MREFNTHGIWAGVRPDVQEQNTPEGGKKEKSPRSKPQENRLFHFCNFFDTNDLIEGCVCVSPGAVRALIVYDQWPVWNQLCCFYEVSEYIW